jgi:hypothetical protein
MTAVFSFLTPCSYTLTNPRGVLPPTLDVDGNTVIREFEAGPGPVTACRSVGKSRFLF